MTTPFVHLRLHSEYSIHDGLVGIKPLVQSVCALQMPAVAITDHVNLFSVVKFYTAAMKAGVKPIIGADLAIYNENKPQEPYWITVLCQNHEGYQSLSRLISRAFIEGQHPGIATPTLRKEWLQGETDNLLALSGERASDLGQALLNHDEAGARELLNSWLALFPDRFYIELQRNQRPGQENYIAAAVYLAQEAGVPVVATNDVRFLDAEEYDAHEARVCIQQGRVLADPNRARNYTAHQYLKTQEEMAVLFADIPESLANTIAIAKRCSVELSLGRVFLPKFPTPEQHTTETYCSELARIGLEERFVRLFPDDNAESQAQKKIYTERLETELSVINSMGFAGYFLIVADFIRWSLQNGIPVGPGRGSGAGSIVAYALKITDLDPLQYELLFERFLNPERVSMPDFDIDFCMVGRDRVIEYVSEKYGRHCVAQIITFGTMAAKAVVRDCGRVLGFPYGFVDKIAKLIPFELGITLDKALEQEEALRARYEQEDDVRELIDLAQKLEGITRNAGKHAGGVVIAPSDLTDFTALYCEEGDDSLAVTQFDKDDVEAVGLIKFDFLGLRTLTIIDWATKMINQRLQENGLEPVNTAYLQLNDPVTFELIKNCETTAVFQVESRGMKDLIRRLQPDCFEDIIALVALFRPGPLQSGMVDDFIERKHGRAQVIYPHEALSHILSPTYGVILYQEQVMQIAQVLAGYTLGGADLLRRAMGKKKAEEMAKQREIFLIGAAKNNVDPDTANTIFDLMDKFSGYGFNKSHAAVYALISYQTAWLKAHYPAEYMAAVLSSDMDNTDKVVMMVDECRRMKIKLLPPDIHASVYYFIVPEPNTIRFGLGAIKGVGEAAINEMIQARARVGRFDHLLSFCRELDTRKVNRRVLDALIRSGAMDSIEPERARLLSQVDYAIAQAEQFHKKRQQKQKDLFGNGDVDTTMAFVPEHAISVKPLSDAERLQGEKATIGFYLTGHPLDRYQDDFRNMNVHPFISLQPARDKVVKTAGTLLNVRTIFTKTGSKMAILTFEDHYKKLDITVFSDLLQDIAPTLHKDMIYVIEGEVSIDSFNQQLRMLARKVTPISDVRMQARLLTLRMNDTLMQSINIPGLAQLLGSYRGGPTLVQMVYESEGGSAVLNLAEEWYVHLKPELLLQLEDLIGAPQLNIAY